MSKERGNWKSIRKEWEEFNEHHLITGLARYYCETSLIPDIIKGKHPFGLYKWALPFETREELGVFYNSYSGNSNAFPATHIAEGIEENVEELLEWIQPLISPPPLLGDSGRNLASAVFNHECLEHLERLKKPWTSVLCWEESD